MYTKSAVGSEGLSAMVEKYYRMSTMIYPDSGNFLKKEDGVFRY
jgi:hypothetical protein